MKALFQVSSLTCLVFWRLASADAADPTQLRQFADPWRPVREAIDEHLSVLNVAVLVGRDERMFYYRKGCASDEKRFWVASSSKMVFVSRVMQMVEDGTIDLHARVNEYLPYWTNSTSDPRSRMTLYHLLSFQSGYTFGLFRPDLDSCWRRPFLNFSDCVRRHYESSTVVAEPGTVWDYNEFHLQVVASVLEQALNATIADILEADLRRWNMTHSRYADHSGPGGPDVSADLVTTAEDYEQFLARYFNGKILRRDTMRFMERDLMPGVVSKVSQPVYLTQGHYGIGNWFTCPFMTPAADRSQRIPPLPDHCRDADVHSDQGFFGFWPVWDRKLGYWMIIAQGGLPEFGDVSSETLYMRIKPLVDAAVRQTATGDSSSNVILT